MSPAVFDSTTPPTPKALAEASKTVIQDEEGKDVALGDLYRDQKTIVLWIRHFYCGLCQDYVQFLGERIKPEALAAVGVKLAIIGCGDWKLIRPYRSLLETPFPVYADPGKKTYTALGMTLRTLDQGGSSVVPEYLRHSAIGNVLMSIMNAFRLGKLSANSGDIVCLRFLLHNPPICLNKTYTQKQLGGEFILGPGEKCFFTHRMENTKGHCPTADLMAAAGVPYEVDAMPAVVTARAQK